VGINFNTKFDISLKRATGHKLSKEGPAEREEMLYFRARAGEGGA